MPDGTNSCGQPETHICACTIIHKSSKIYINTFHEFECVFKNYDLCLSSHSHTHVRAHTLHIYIYIYKQKNILFSRKTETYLYSSIYQRIIGVKLIKTFMKEIEQ